MDIVSNIGGSIYKWLKCFCELKMMVGIDPMMSCYGNCNLGDELALSPPSTPFSEDGSDWEPHVSSSWNKSLFHAPSFKD